MCEDIEAEDDHHCNQWNEHLAKRYEGHAKPGIPPPRKCSRCGELDA